MTPIDLVRPDLVTSLRIDPYAPRAARYQVAQLDRPSPDLRDVVVLLTSELVTHAVEHCQSADSMMELCAWMPADVVRVELHAPRGLLHAPADAGESDYGPMLLDQLADRWSLDDAGHLACMWFEIDRHPPAASQTDGASEGERRSLASS